MTAFDPNTVKLAGLNLIEASAGTGKTYTLAELYLRLILEKGFTVDQILVVTFTDAATQELRARLRQRLVDARDTMLGLASEDNTVGYITEYIAEPQREKARRQLNLAIQSFDEAAIFTIHGFCQRVLRDFAFESGLPFKLELMGDDVDLLQAATDDFWRREVVVAEQETVAYLVSKNETPKTLLRSIRSFIGKPYLKMLTKDVADIAEATAAAQVQFEKVKTTWLKEREDVIAAVGNLEVLRKASYKPEIINPALKVLATLLKKEKLPLTLFPVPLGFEGKSNFKKSLGFTYFCKFKIDKAIKINKSLPALNFWRECELLWKAYEELQTLLEEQQRQLRIKLLSYLKTELPARKLQQQTQSYDDLLLNLEQALHGAQGDWLVEKLRTQYPAALIDEFQDTDPTQYASFSRIYTDSGLAIFLVGDPKQAIYSFRGADIFTYLSAKSSADTHTLGTNWRSHPKLVAAVNALFARQEQPFRHRDIPFQAVKAAREDVPILRVNDETDAPCQIVWLGSSETVTKDKMTQLAAEATANEIASLLNQSAAGKAVLSDKNGAESQAVVGGDIAVLVRTNKQGMAIQDALQVCGINSVQQGKENIFESREAMQLERVLWAIAQPSNEARVKLALVTDLWGLSAADLYALEQDDLQWQVMLDTFYRLHQLWQQHGFTRMLYQWMNDLSVRQHILALPRGERILTNLNHLAELVQKQCSAQKSGMEETLQWLAAQRKSVDPSDETGQLRLENDAQLVKIITIHKSKGLEYPIVFCPFLWDGKIHRKSANPIRYYSAEDKQGYVAFLEPDIAMATPLAREEEQAENMRLLYVALTRAKERCVIMWGDVKQVGNAALFDLLHPNLENISSVEMQTDLAGLVAENEDSMSLTIVADDEKVVYQENTDIEQSLAARTFSGAIQRPWAVGSFTGLTRSSSHHHDVELPDYDAHQAMDVSAAPESTELNRFSFPRGAQAGVCLHALFEYWDFTSQDTDAMHVLVRRTLLQYGFDDEKWTGVACQWLREVLATPLHAGLHLADLTLAKRLDELAFYFPVASLTVARLKQALLPVLEDDSALATVIKRLRFSTLTGFMKGFIDLVFEHEGRFYVVDYKSNHLGDNAADYQADAVERAMIGHDYPLQYAIYSLALHRYLKLRLPDYDPEHHFGGVYYLFIRGMHPEWGQAENRAGVFFDRPSPAMLAALDSCMQGDKV